MKIPTATRNAACQALVDLFDAAGAGYVEIRSGTPPATADDAATGSVLATVVLPNPAFDTAGTTGAGVATAEAIAIVQGVANGTATWFRAYDGANTPIEDGTVSTPGSGGEMEMNTTAVSIGVDIAITSWSITMPGS